jgi:hypothetical protein
MSKDSSVPRKVLARAIDYKRTFQSQSGQRVLHDLMDKHWILRSTSDDIKPELASYRERERKVVLGILEILNVDVEGLKKKIEESEKNAREQRDYHHTIV